MSIPEEAVEAAAGAEYEAAEGQPWGSATDFNREDYIRVARIGLEAAAQFLGPPRVGGDE